ncbi:MAG: DPP IV N-terminal domain-containing protein, partial [Cryomorphaceae bacterium]|nr:DPP IV N-terminal domain-containing protein [Cryomorphaceae bacterium]
MTKRFITFALTVLLAFNNVAQEKKTVSIKDVWGNYQFYTQGVSGLRSMADGEHFTTKKSAAGFTHILKHSYKNGEVVDTLFSTSQLEDNIAFDNYDVSSDERFVILFSETESIYRYSSKSIVRAVDLITKNSYLISKEKIQLPVVSPDAKYVSYVYKNNLYLYNLQNKSVKALTEDGEHNKIIYGATDWVYEEEFQFDRAYEWSPDGKYLAYYRFDETDVPEFSMDIYGDDLYPTQDRFKYPKAGEVNAKVSVFTYNPEDNTHNPVIIENQPEYIGRIKWRTHSDLALFSLNRHQNELIIFNHHVKTNKTEPWYKETDEAFVEMDDNQFFLSNGEFIRLSGKDGYYHLYHINNKGTEKQITSGKWDITELYGYNPSSKRLYFQAAKDAATERGIYSVRLNGKSFKQLHKDRGWNDAKFSEQCKYFINNHSSVGRVNRYDLFDEDGRHIRNLQDNQAVQDRIDNQFEL